MRRPLVLALLVGLAVGGSYCYVNYDFDVRRGEEGVESITIRPKQRTPGAEPVAEQPSDGSPGGTIRIATYNLSRLDEKKLRDPRAGAVLAHVIRRYDVVAVQGIGVANRTLLVRLADQVNAEGRQYDFEPAPDAAPYCAFLFDRARIEIDRAAVQLVDDPQHRFRHRPLVALFRVKGPAPAEAFTFKLINVPPDPDRSGVDPGLLGDIYKAVRDDEPEEDDVIVLGDLGAGGDAPGQPAEMPGITSAISDTPTTIRGTQPVDNVLFDARATAEFTGRAGVLDLMREFDLTWREVSEVSVHLPVWAEFDTIEGGSPGHLADKTDRKTR